MLLGGNLIATQFTRPGRTHYHFCNLFFPLLLILVDGTTVHPRSEILSILPEKSQSNPTSLPHQSRDFNLSTHQLRSEEVPAHLPAAALAPKVQRNRVVLPRQSPALLRKASIQVSYGRNGALWPNHGTHPASKLRLNSLTTL